jgi:hypothetical protein
MKIKKILEIVGWTMALAGTTFLLAFASSEQDKTVCKLLIFNFIMEMIH